MIRSTGTRGSTLPASFPALFIADRMAARSTTAGTPVKSCIRTRAGRYGSSASFGGGARPAPRTLTCFSGLVRAHVDIFLCRSARFGQAHQAFEEHLDGHRQAGGVMHATFRERAERVE